MKPRELAILLNISQGQIARALQSPSANMLLVPRYDLECWQRKMREVEMHLRNMETN